APLVRVVRTAARPQASAPFVGEHDFAAIVRERSRMPVRVVRIIHGIQSLGIYRVPYVKQNSIPRARARCQADRRVHGDVVALVSVRRLLRALLAWGAAVIQAVDRASARIDKYSRTRYNLRFLRRSHWNFDH